MQDHTPIDASFTVLGGAKAPAENAPQGSLFWPVVLTVIGVGYFAALSVGFEDPAQRAIAVIAAGLQWPFWRALWAVGRSASSKVSEEDAEALRDRYLRGSSWGVKGRVRSVTKAPPAK